MGCNWDIKTENSLDWFKYQPGGVFALGILDPPYNVKYRYRGFSDEIPPSQYLHEQLLTLTHWQRLLKPGGSVFYLNYPETVAEIWARVDFLAKVDLIPWVYNAHTQGSPLRKACRLWAWFSKGEPTVHPEALAGEYKDPNDPRIKELIRQGKKPQAYDWIQQEQVKNSNPAKRGLHCQLPQDMVERWILATTDKGDLVGDCFLGSGTTALAALKHGRRFSGCEMVPAFAEAAREAVRKFEGTRLLPLEIGSGF